MRCVKSHDASRALNAPRKQHIEAALLARPVELIVGPDSKPNVLGVTSAHPSPF
jgi:hypothetical protein